MWDTSTSCAVVIREGRRRQGTRLSLGARGLMMRLAAAAFLPAVALAQSLTTVTLCQTDDAACTLPSGTDMTVPTGTVKVFKVDIATSQSDGPGDCPATCEKDGIVYCQGVCPPAPEELDRCSCVDGWQMGFDVSDIQAGLTDGPGGQISGLAFAVSRKDPTTVAVTAADAYALYDTGAWEITSKEFNNAHEVNVGRKGHKQADVDLVELCRTVWDGATTATRADAECNCADCETACGLRGSRRSTPCDDSPCSGHFSDGSSVAASRCASATLGGSVGHCEDPNDMCDDKFTMQPNCTAYAMSDGLPPDTSSLGYCCGMKPRSFTDAVGAERLYFPTGWAQSDEWTDEYCELDRNAENYGYEKVLRLPKRMEYSTCSGTDMTEGSAASEFYLYVVNTHTADIQLPAITWSKGPISDAQVAKCAEPVVGGAAQAAPVAVLAALLAALWY